MFFEVLVRETVSFSFIIFMNSEIWEEDKEDLEHEMRDEIDDVNLNEEKDWYNESDTSDDVPDPYDSPEALFQELNQLPRSLHKSHFEEGLIYTMTLKQKYDVHLLVMIIETKERSFTYRVFFVTGAKRKTFHEGLKDKQCSYQKVWRLAPRRELIRNKQNSNFRVGETLRFKYGMDAQPITVLVISSRSRDLTGCIEAGVHRGQKRVFEYVEMGDVMELFGSSILQSLHSQAHNSSWEEADKVNSFKIPITKPKLHWTCPPDEPHKRK